MYEFIEDLKDKVILNEKIILDLKSYIHKKYPDKSSRELSLILADGIHKIISSSMDRLQEELRIQIEKYLIGEAVKSSDFSITAYKVFSRYCEMGFEYDNSMDELHDWLCSIQSSPPSREELVCFVSSREAYEGPLVEKGEETIPENSISTTGKGAEIKQSIFKGCAAVFQVLRSSFLRLSGELKEFFKREMIPGLRPYGKRGLIAAVSAAVIILTAFSFKSMDFFSRNAAGTIDMVDSKGAAFDTVSTDEVEERLENGLPEELQYIEVDKELLRKWLLDRDSMLGEEPYLTSILNIAKEYNINPLFMIAITGQEQGFVPKKHKNALKIANNPFNVYESWSQYNTDIEDSAKIAAQTIINLSRDRPKDAHAIQWINNKYAEDKNWWVGVNKIFNAMREEIIK